MKTRFVYGVEVPWEFDLAYFTDRMNYVQRCNTNSRHAFDCPISALNEVADEFDIPPRDCETIYDRHQSPIAVTIRIKHEKAISINAKT